MKWTKRIAIILLSLVGLIILANFGLNWWVAQKLPHIINRENDTPYKITYKDIDISLLTRHIEAKQIIVVPRSSLDAKGKKPGLYAKIESLEVDGFSIWQILGSNRIQAQNLVIDKPQITLLKTNNRAIDNPKSIGNEVVKPFSKIITVSNVFLKNGSIKITGIAKNNPILDVANVNVKLEGIAITDKTLSQKLPFTFETYTIDCDSVFYQRNEFYHMVTRRISTTNTGIAINGFKFVPEYNRETFARKVPAERDWFAISADSIAINRMNWGFVDEQFGFAAQSVILDNVSADIYRNKGPTDDQKKKKLYSELLRNLRFAMRVDTLQMRHSKLRYEETSEFGKSPGVLTFSKFNLRAIGIQSGFAQTKMADVRIKILCNFMETSRLDVDWTFNVLDKADRFNIRGRFFNFPAERLSPFTKPYMNATFKGSLDEVYFNFNGNDNGAKGDFGINYDNLKVSIYREDKPKKKRKFLSAIANLFVKNDSKDKVNHAEIAVERDKQRSFFNLLWKCLEAGLKQILL